MNVEIPLGTEKVVFTGQNDKQFFPDKTQFLLKNQKLNTVSNT
jgi:hypothetical protein